MRGISALPTVLLLSGIILQVVIAGLAVSQLFSRSLLSEQLSIETLEAAKSGAHDAILRVNDHITCPDSVIYNDAAAKCPSLYKFTVNDVLVNRVACVSIGAISGGQMTILSRGSAFLSHKTIRVVLGITTTEARVEVQSFKEIETPSGVFASCN